ncbi:hypothetical protein BDZ89DRAFT_1160573 [Hymenopellis radicata]|nr:hypothetical protein BDZ89DRAFT_1160573 [Hymenopellis radicata]
MTESTHIDADTLNIVASPDDGPGEIFPSRINRTTGQFTEIKVDISSSAITKKRLQFLCATFKLPQTGNKTVLEERLRVFSKDKEQWTRYAFFLIEFFFDQHHAIRPFNTAVPKRRKHKGPREHLQDTRNNATESVDTVIKTKSRPKLSTILREQKFGGNNSTGIAGSKDLRSEDQKAELLLWAAQLSKENEAMRLRRRAQKLAATHSHLSTTPKVSIIPNSHLDNRLDRIEQQITSILSQTSPFPVSATSSEPTVAPNYQNGVPPLSVNSTSPIFTSSSPASIPSSEVEHVMTIDAPGRGGTQEMDTVMTSSCSVDTAVHTAMNVDVEDTELGARQMISIGHGKIVEFYDHQLPSPLLLKFTVENVPFLARIWNDERSEWDPSNYGFKVNGVHVALRYWDDLYKYRSDGQWTLTKSTWTKWKFFMQAYETFATPAEFWNHFSTKDGKRRSIAQILRQLKEERTSRNTNLAQQARVYYGDRFNELFRYRKGGRTEVMQKDDCIARRYLQLQRGVTESDSN